MFSISLHEREHVGAKMKVSASADVTSKFTALFSRMQGIEHQMQIMTAKMDVIMQYKLTFERAILQQDAILCALNPDNAKKSHGFLSASFQMARQVYRWLIQLAQDSANCILAALKNFMQNNANNHKRQLFKSC